MPRSEKSVLHEETWSKGDYPKNYRWMDLPLRIPVTSLSLFTELHFLFLL